jgi:hypothetical protein
VGGWDDLPSRSPVDGPSDGFRRDPAGILLEALEHAARAGSVRGVGMDEADVDAPVRASGGGCIRRLILLGLLLAAMFLLVPLLLGGALLRLI